MSEYVTAKQFVDYINNDLTHECYAVQRDNYIFVYADWRDARDEDHKGRWFMMIPLNIESLAELDEREDWDPDLVSPAVFWPIVELIAKYERTPLDKRLEGVKAC